MEYLGMTVVTGGYAVIRTDTVNLLKFHFTVVPACFGKPRLQETAPAATTKIVGPVGLHINKILFTNHGRHHKPELFGNRIPQRFSDQLAGVLHGKLHLQIPIPVGVDLQFALPDPLRVVFDDTFDFKFVLNLELIQSDPD